MSTDLLEDLPPNYHHEERERRIDHMVQVARVVKTDPTKARAQVEFNGATSGWLPYGKLRSKGTRTWNPVQEGEQVAVFAPSGNMEQAFIWGSIPYEGDDTKEAGDSNDVEVTQYPDGTKISYDHKEHKFKAAYNEGASVEHTVGGATLTHNKDGFTMKCGDMTFKISSGGVAVDGGTFTHNGKNIGKDHKHTKVVTGTAKTGEPE